MDRAHGKPVALHAARPSAVGSGLPANLAMDPDGLANRILAREVDEGRFVFQQRDPRSSGIVLTSIPDRVSPQYPSPAGILV